MKIRWGRIVLLLMCGVFMAGFLDTAFGLDFWERLLVMQVPLMLLVWLLEPVKWEE